MLNTSHRVTCNCGATIARNTHNEIIHALQIRDWRFCEVTGTATCLECQLNA